MGNVGKVGTSLNKDIDITTPKKDVDKTIVVKSGIKDKLMSMGNLGDSYSTVIGKLIDHYESSNKK